MESTNPYTAPKAELNSPASADTYSPKLHQVNGRIGRVQYFAFSVMMSLICIILFAFANLLSLVIQNGQQLETPSIPHLIIMAGVGLYALVMSLLLIRRRLHDIEKPAWLIVLSIVPVINLILYGMLSFIAGTTGKNQHGPAPEAPTAIQYALGLLIPLIFILGIAVTVLLPILNKQ